MAVRENPIAAACRYRSILIFQPENPREQLLPWLRAHSIDLGLVFAYGHLLRRDVLATPSLGFVNVHASLLPELRGPSPIEAAICQRKKKTGLTLMQLVWEMDAGPVYGWDELAIDSRETAVSLREKLGKLAVRLLEKYWEPLLAGNLRTVPQDHGRATFCSLLKKEDGRLDFSQSAEELDARVRAHGHWPGSFFSHGGETIRVGKAEVGEGPTSLPPGTVLGLVRGALEIATGNGILRCLKLQRPTRRMLPASQVFRGLINHG
jgi:methionyl-tRNA formyltransferase